MATSFCLFLATIYNQSQLAERKHVARHWYQHSGNGCSIKRAPLSVSYYNEISNGHIWRGLYGGGVLPAQYCPCGSCTTGLGLDPGLRLASNYLGLRLIVSLGPNSQTLSYDLS